jgi:hypothetical protein
MTSTPTTSTATQDGADASARLDATLATCSGAGVLVLDAELTGPAVHADLVDLQQLEQVAQHLPASILYLQRRHFDDVELARRTAQLARAEAALAAPSDDDTRDPVVGAARMSQLRRRLEQALEVARTTLADATEHQGCLGSADMTLVAGGVAHDYTHTEAWMAELEDRFDDLTEAQDLYAEPEEALDDEDLEAQYAQQAAQRQEREKERKRALAAVGARLRHRLIDDLAFQQTAAADRRWKYAQRVLAEEFDMDDIALADRGVLKEHVDEAYRQVTVELVPSIRRSVLDAIDDHVTHLMSQPAWQAATTLKSRTRIAREYLLEVHPLIATPALVEQILAAVTARAGARQSSLL